MSKEKTLSEIIADYTLRTDFKDIPDWVADRTKSYILDFIGCAFTRLNQQACENIIGHIL